MGNIYVGANNIARKIKSAYVGVNGVARKVKQVYIGDANGKARLVWSAWATTVSKLKGTVSYNNNLWPTLTDRAPGDQPFGYELVQKENIYPYSNTDYACIITVNSDGSAVSAERIEALDNTNNNYTRTTVMLIDDDNIYSLVSYVDYKFHKWYKKSTGTTHTSNENSTNYYIRPVAALPDGYIMSISESVSTSLNYNLYVMYPGSNTNLTASSLSVYKKLVESSSMNLVMLTPNKGVVHEYYYSSKKLFLRSFSRNGNTITEQKTTEITQVTGIGCNAIKMVDESHFFTQVDGYLAYYRIDDNYNTSFITSIPFTPSSIQTVCRVGKTNSFIFPERMSSTVHLFSFTDTSIVSHGTYTSSITDRYNSHTFPFGDKGVIIFTYDGSYGYLKTTIETFE